MLAFARRQELKPETVDVGELVAGMTELLSSSLGPGIEVEAKFPHKLSPILIDVNQLELAILNLAVNAKDAMPEGGRLTITAREIEAERSAALQAGRYVCLTVTDTGEGMDAATLARAMEPFFTTKGVGKGTGLGLAMVRGLSEQSGGTITIESKVGEGTSVTLWIPVGTAVSAPAIAPPPSAARAASRRLKVLVVDDDVR
jgi:signal transduction histidine kinase